MPRVLIVGSEGQLGSELMAAAWPSGAEIVGRDLPALDVSRPEAVAEVLGDVGPALVVNAAAYTQVDRAEAEPERAFLINEAGCGHLAEWCARRSVPLVHMSTDYVFDGRSPRAYREDDEPHPLGIYGRSKLAGERAIRQRRGPHLILRTSWLFGVAGGNFVKTMLRLGAEREEVRVVNDQHGCPTPARDLAGAIAQLARRSLDGEPLPWGLYHYAGRDETTWFDFAGAIFAGAKARGLGTPRLVPITTAEHGAAAPRPARSVLDCGLIERTFGIRPPSWREGLERVLAELAQDPRSRT